MAFDHKQKVYESTWYANERGRRKSHKRFLLSIMAELTHDSKECDSICCGGRDKSDVHPGNFDNYEGWCWAGQDTLAQRAGCHVNGVRHMLYDMSADGLFRVRRYRDKAGHPHLQYALQMDVIESKIPCTVDCAKPEVATQSLLSRDTDAMHSGLSDHAQSSVPSHTQSTFEPHTVDCAVGVDLGVDLNGCKNGCSSSPVEIETHGGLRPPNPLPTQPQIPATPSCKAGPCRNEALPGSAFCQDHQPPPCEFCGSAPRWAGQRGCHDCVKTRCSGSGYYEVLLKHNPIPQGVATNA
jgi:hypothetical protein